MSSFVIFFTKTLGLHFRVFLILLTYAKKKLSEERKINFGSKVAVKKKGEWNSITQENRENRIKKLKQVKQKQNVNLIHS